MYELYLVRKNQDFRQRLFPFVLRSAKIHDITSMAGHLEYWGKELTKAEEAMRKLDITQTAPTGIHAKFDRLRRVVQNADEILSFVADMNTLTPDMLEEDDFATLKEAVDRQIQDGR